jgi:hypothetical protein
MFNHSKYHFNNLGEFSMNITSAVPVTSKDLFMKNKLTNDIEVVEVLQSGNAHRVLIHPDGLSISGLTIREVPTLMDLMMKEELITADLIRELLPGCMIEVLPMTIIVSSNTNSTAAKEVLGWFDSALKASSAQALIDMGVSGSFIPRIPIKRVIGEGGHGMSIPLHPKIDNFILLLASEMGGHRNASSVLILPYEDSFEFVSSSERAATIIANYTILN